MSIIQSGQILVKANISNTAVTANTNIFPTSVKPSQTFAIFICYACFVDTGNLSVVRNGLLEVLNQASPLAATGAYIFSFPVFSGDTINLQYSATTTATKLVLLEDMGPRL